MQDLIYNSLESANFASIYLTICFLFSSRQL